jgi:hypothetical protein
MPVAPVWSRDKQVAIVVNELAAARVRRRGPRQAAALTRAGRFPTPLALMPLAGRTAEPQLTRRAGAWP